MNYRLRIGIIVSVLLHITLISPLYGFVFFRETSEPKGPVVVDYVVVKQAKDVDLSGVIAVRKAADPARRATAGDTASDRTSNNNVSVKPAPGRSTHGSASGSGKAEARIRATKEYVSYYQLIRGKIRDRLRDNYKASVRDGNVFVRFILSADGKLVSVRIDGASDSAAGAKIADLAMRSVKEAAPFPEFPKALSLPQMSFDLAINFKRQ